MITAEIAEAAYADDPRWMPGTSTKLRWFITDNFDPFFGCDSAEVLAMVDERVARLRRVITSRRTVS